MIKKWDQTIHNLPVESSGNKIVLALPSIPQLKHLSLIPPQITIHVENTFPKGLEHFPELRAFRVVGEICVQNVLNVRRVTGDDELHVGEERGNEVKRAVTLFKNFGSVKVDAPDVVEKRRQHANYRPAGHHRLLVQSAVANHNKK